MYISSAACPRHPPVIYTQETYIHMYISSAARPRHAQSSLPSTSRHPPACPRHLPVLVKQENCASVGTFVPVRQVLLALVVRKNHL